MESVRQNATTIASMFGLEDKVDELMANFDRDASDLRRQRAQACLLYTSP